ncbi:MAG: ABC1 kinase family protein [Acidimicrobiia bacterium]
MPKLKRFRLRELARMGAVGAVVPAMVLKSMVVGVFRRRKRSFKTIAADGLVDAFIVLGPTYVKLGQLISSSPGVFPPTLADACQRCLDEVPPFSAAAARKVVAADLGCRTEDVFASFEDVPLAAASIAQVHACVLADGRHAVVKLQRPRIARRMNTDLRIMYRLARVLMRFELGRVANATAVVEDLHQVTNQELNFALEAHRQTRFRNGIGAFGDNDYITVPEVYWDYCGPRTICMERMWGIPMDEFEALKARNIDGEMVLRRGVKVWMEAAMVHGPFHGDVHAGNLWVLDDGRACYLDFGIMGELDDQWKQILRDLQYTAMIDGDFTRVARNWKDVGVVPESAGTDEDVGKRIKVVLDPLLDMTVGEMRIGDLLKQNFDLAKQLGAHLPKELVLISKQLLYFERYAKELAPNYRLARDIYLVKNVFPDAVATKAAEDGIDLPD